MNEHSLEEQVLPPPEPLAVYRIAIIGIVLAGIAAVLNPISDSLSTIRLLLVAAGCLTAGSAISMRPMLPLAWLMGAVTFALAWPGLPAHWDSARLVVAVGSGVCLGAVLLSALPRSWRCSILSVMAMWHFGGIFCATTWPDPTPWTTRQIGTNMYLPYLMFMYLRNAYHFYSPNPGPASHLFALVKSVNTKTGETRHHWMTLPKRSTQMKDPLGLTYFRRLSITEQASQTAPAPILSFEANDITRRRQRVAGGIGGYSNYPKIPIAPDEFEAQSGQYRMPQPTISRYLLPSYANFILKSEAEGDWKPVSVKLYRLEHRVMPTFYFVKGGDMNNPTTFRPYYLGEFAENPATDKVELVDPQDPMLYWYVPILPKPGTTGPEHVEYLDYMSEHAGFKYDWEKHKP